MDREAGHTNAIFFEGSELDFLSTGRSSSSSPVSFLLLVALLAAFSPDLTSVVSSTNDMSKVSACASDLEMLSYLLSRCRHRLLLLWI